MAVDVVLALAPAVEGAVAQAVAADRRLRLTRRCADLAEAVAACTAGLARVAVLSAQSHLDRDTVTQLARIGVRVIGVSASDDERAALAAIGVETVVPGDRADDVVEAICSAPLPRLDAIAAPPPSVVAPGARGSVVAVWGTAGAPGRTTLAVNLAAELARGAGALLLDLDTFAAAVAPTLGVVDDAPGIAALARVARAGAVTPDDVARHACDVGGGLRVVTGVRAKRWPELTPSALDALWPVLRESAPITVIDCDPGLDLDETRDERAPQRHGATRGALEEADAVLVVGSAAPLGLQRLVHALGDLADELPEVRARARVVVTGVRRSVAGPTPERQVADALARYAGVDRVWTIPWDSRTADEAALRGVTWRECGPRSPGTRAIAALAHDLARDLADTPAPSSATVGALTQ